jgi:hypothetical protein
MSRKISNIARWIILLPAAVTAALLSTFPLHWLLYLKFARNGTFLGMIELPPNSNLTIEYLLYPCVMAVVFVWSGYKIAPTHKFKAAIALFGLYVTVWLGIVVFTLAGGNIGNTPANFGVRTVLALIGSGVGLYLAKHENKQDKAKSQLEQKEV